MNEPDLYLYQIGKNMYVLVFNYNYDKSQDFPFIGWEMYDGELFPLAFTHKQCESLICLK